MIRWIILGRGPAAGRLRDRLGTPKPEYNKAPPWIVPGEALVGPAGLEPATP